MGRCSSPSVCLSVCLSVCFFCIEHNSKTNGPEVFKLGIESDPWISYKFYGFGFVRSEFKVRVNNNTAWGSNSISRPNLVIIIIIMNRHHESSSSSSSRFHLSFKVIH